MSLVDPNAHDRRPPATGRRRPVFTAPLLLCAAAAGYGGSISGDFPGSTFTFGFTEYGPMAKVGNDR